MLNPSTYGFSFLFKLLFGSGASCEGPCRGGGGELGSRSCFSHASRLAEGLPDMETRGSQRQHSLKFDGGLVLSLDQTTRQSKG